MRILVLSNMYPSTEKPYAGVFVKNQVEILRELTGANWRIDVAAMPRRFTGSAGTALKYLGFALRSIPLLFRRYDVVHVHFFVPLAALGTVYKFFHPSARLVVTFHGGDVAAAHFRGWRGRLWRRISKSIDLGIAVGTGVSEAVGRYLSPARTILLPAGVDSRKFYLPGPGPRSKKYDLVFAGSFIPRKGLDVLVEALKDQAFRDVRLALVGTGSLQPLVEELGQCRSVEIFGHLSQDQMREVYWASRFLVLPSRSEPFGLVVSEALFSGIPAIVSNEPGPAMQVTDGVNGLVCEKDSVSALREALARALQMDEIRYLDMAGAAIASNRQFDVYEVTRTLVGEYARLAGRQEKVL
jgi:glycosyltransferase involved in cell wall biosynthesis